MKKSLWDPEPQTKKDVLEQLLHIDGVPGYLNRIRRYNAEVQRHCARAADEIEKLRKENKHLKKLLRENNISLNQWIIVGSRLNKNGQFMYLAKSQKGYTSKIENAYIFGSREEALENIAEFAGDKPTYGQEKVICLKEE